MNDNSSQRSTLHTLNFFVSHQCAITHFTIQKTRLNFSFNLSIVAEKKSSRREKQNKTPNPKVRRTELDFRKRVQHFHRQMDELTTNRRQIQPVTVQIIYSFQFPMIVPSVCEQRYVRAMELVLASSSKSNVPKISSSHLHLV